MRTTRTYFSFFTFGILFSTNVFANNPTGDCGIAGGAVEKILKSQCEKKCSEKYDQLSEKDRKSLVCDWNNIDQISHGLWLKAGAENVTMPVTPNATTPEIKALSSQKIDPKNYTARIKRIGDLIKLQTGVSITTEQAKHLTGQLDRLKIYDEYTQLDNKVTPAEKRTLNVRILGLEASLARASGSGMLETRKHMNAKINHALKSGKISDVQKSKLDKLMADYNAKFAALSTGGLTPDEEKELLEEIKKIGDDLLFSSQSKNKVDKRADLMLEKLELVEMAANKKTPLVKEIEKVKNEFLRLKGKASKQQVVAFHKRLNKVQGEINHFIHKQSVQKGEVINYSKSKKVSPRAKEVEAPVSRGGRAVPKK